MLSTSHLSMDDRIESLHFSLFSYFEQENKLYNIFKGNTPIGKSSLRGETTREKNILIIGIL